jgi:hypothetical protein
VAVRSYGLRRGDIPMQSQVEALMRESIWRTLFPGRFDGGLV